ncbi:arginase family protein [Microbacterium gorillae]|uniref:arginase family protein n=1 Tax=Microbacterium gorillae TaxID=1231063 RepID=UPI00058B3CDB|nr:arginase family protein [Microbacterium gorillae]
MTRFVVVPQWQGSPQSRAMALADGAEAISGDLPHAKVVHVDVPLEAGEPIETGVLRASSLRRVQEELTVALDRLPDDEHALVVGGDCSVSVPAVAHVAGDDLALVWFDAHPDLHTADSSPSGAFAGMALRAILGDGSETLVSGALAPERVVLIGARARDEAEVDHLASSPITDIAGDDLGPATVVAAVAASGATRVYVHIDLDVLDPAAIVGVGDAVPFGLTRTQVVDTITALRERFPLAGATVAGFSPASPTAAVEDLGTILRIIGALA